MDPAGQTSITCLAHFQGGEVKEGGGVGGEERNKEDRERRRKRKVLSCMGEIERKEEYD